MLNSRDNANNKKELIFEVITIKEMNAVKNVRLIKVLKVQLQLENAAANLFLYLLLILNFRRRRIRGVVRGDPV